MHSSSLRIIHCLVFYLPVRTAGIEVYVQALTRYLAQCGHQVKILVPNYPGEPPYPSQDGGVPIITYNETYNQTRDAFAGKVPGSGLPQFEKILQYEQPDIVHFHQLTSSNGISIFHFRAAKATGAKVVFTNHLAGLTCSTGTMNFMGTSVCNGKMDERNCSRCLLHAQGHSQLATTLMVQAGKMFHLIGDLKFLPAKWQMPATIAHKRRRLHELFSICDQVITPAAWYQQLLIDNGFPAEKVVLVKQGLANAVDFQKPPVPKSVDAVVRFIYAARIFPEKGLDTLLMAMQQIKGSFVLDIFGQEDGAAYKAFCESLSKENPQIRWFDALPHVELMKQFSKYDVLVIPSRVAEMAPLVIPEATAAGLPVLGTAIGGISEAIQDGITGWLFPMNDVQALANQIQQLILQPERIAKAAAKLNRTIRPFEAVGFETEQIYLKIAGNNAGINKQV